MPQNASPDQSIPALLVQHSVRCSDSAQASNRNAVVKDLYLPSSADLAQIVGESGLQFGNGSAGHVTILVPCRGPFKSEIMNPSKLGGFPEESS